MIENTVFLKGAVAKMVVNEADRTLTTPELFVSQSLMLGIFIVRHCALSTQSGARLIIGEDNSRDAYILNLVRKPAGQQEVTNRLFAPQNAELVIPMDQQLFETAATLTTWLNLETYTVLRTGLKFNPLLYAAILHERKIVLDPGFQIEGSFDTYDISVGAAHILDLDYLSE